ncbi:hypothetical protein CYLTODRAFT_441848 [Cylindrobasidium torrendii FP15055 ss-10]|uniref:Uncharacterized protein n=1 Tax=Cylindrobasidium torrendii FP15055 ss-10 TaxID=1314674 RepID=A0A0D7BK75_9AGAR|nr:hypothetical protein CYLTODRAFT_441848 [Cylindrobasidium torrendii FP15055 ss-10]
MFDTPLFATGKNTRNLLHSIFCWLIGCSVRHLLTSNDMESPPTNVPNGTERTTKENIAREAIKWAITELLRSQNVDGVDDGDLALLLEHSILDHNQPMDAQSWQSLYENNIPAERWMRLSAEQIQTLQELYERGREFALVFEGVLGFDKDWKAQENENTPEHPNASHISSFAQYGTHERYISSSGGGSAMKGGATISVSRRTSIQHASAVTAGRRTGHNGILPLSETGLGREAQRNETNSLAFNPGEEFGNEQQRLAEIRAEVLSSMGSDSVDEIREFAEELVGKPFQDFVENTVSLRVATPQASRASYPIESYRDNSGAPHYKIARTDNGPIPAHDDEEAPRYAWPEDFEAALTPTSQSSDFSEVMTSSSSTVVNTPPPTDMAAAVSQRAYGAGVAVGIADKAYSPAPSNALSSALPKADPPLAASVDAGAPASGVGSQVRLDAVYPSPSMTPVVAPANDGVAVVQHLRENMPPPSSATPALSVPSAGSSSSPNSLPGVAGPQRYNRAGLKWDPDRNMPSKGPSPPGTLVSPDPSFLEVYTDEERLNFHDLPKPVKRQLIFDVDEIKRLFDVNGTKRPNTAHGKRIIEEQIQEWQDRYDCGKEKYSKKWPAKTARKTINGAIESLIKIIERFEECEGCIPIPGQLARSGFSAEEIHKPFPTYDSKTQTWSAAGPVGSRGQKRSRD